MANWVRDFLQEHPELSDKIVKRAKHAIHTLNDDGTITARFTGAPMHYQDNEGIWRELDTAIKDLGDGTFGAEGIPIRLLQNGLVKLFNAQNEELYSQVTSRVAVYNATTMNLVQTQDLPTGVIDDNKLVKDTSLYTHTLTLKETGLREEILIKERPSFITDNANLWFVLDTVITGFEFADGWLDDEHSKEEFRFTLPKARDAEGREGNPRRYAKKIGGVQHIFTGLKFSELYNASYPVTIDPDFTAASGFCYIEGVSGSYSTARSTPDYFDYDDDATVRNSYTSSYVVTRVFMKFDTSSIVGTVSQVNLKMTFAWLGVDTDFDVEIVKCDWSSYDPIESEEGDAYNLAISSDLDDAIFRNTSGASTDTPYTSGNLNTAWVNISGDTYYAIVNDNDYDNETPTDEQEVGIYYPGTATAAYRPTLTVTYATGCPVQAMHYKKMRGG